MDYSRDANDALASGVGKYAVGKAPSNSIITDCSPLEPERQRETVAQRLRRIVATAGDQRVALSAVGLTELVHAIHRASNPVHRQKHERFIADLLTDMEVVPYVKAAALPAAADRLRVTEDTIKSHV